MKLWSTLALVLIPAASALAQDRNQPPKDKDDEYALVRLFTVDAGVELGVLLSGVDFISTDTSGGFHDIHDGAQGFVSPYVQVTYDDMIFARVGYERLDGKAFDLDEFRFDVGGYLPFEKHPRFEHGVVGYLGLVFANMQIDRDDLPGTFDRHSVGFDAAGGYYVRFGPHFRVSVLMGVRALAFNFRPNATADVLLTDDRLDLSGVSFIVSAEFNF